MTFQCCHFYAFCLNFTPVSAPASCWFCRASLINSRLFNSRWQIFVEQPGRIRVNPLRVSCLCAKPEVRLRQPSLGPTEESQACSGDTHFCPFFSISSHLSPEPVGPIISPFLLCPPLAGLSSQQLSGFWIWSIWLLGWAAQEQRFIQCKGIWIYNLTTQRNWHLEPLSANMPLHTPCTVIAGGTIFQWNVTQIRKLIVGFSWEISPESRLAEWLMVPSEERCTGTMVYFQKLWHYDDEQSIGL